MVMFIISKNYYAKNYMFLFPTGCPELTAPENGQVEYTTEEGDFASYTCETGYILQGQNARQCVSGSWTNNEPTCQIIGES